MARSELTIDLGAIRRNAKTLLDALAGTELWAVVKADGYGHGAVNVADAALGAGATALCVATVPEALVLRPRVREHARILVIGPAVEPRDRPGARGAARARRLRRRLAPGGHPAAPEARHRHGPLRPRRAAGAADRRWSGFMSHLATADSDPAFAEQQIERFREATAPYPGYIRHIANSAAALRLPVVALRRRAVRDRAVRASRRSAATRPTTGSSRALLAQRARAGQAPRARGRAPATAARSSPSSRPGSGSCRSATATASGAT